MEVTTAQQDELIAAARAAREQAYAPYSEFLVGAAVLTDDGRIFTGVNVENASYGLTVCAERHAVGAMILAGGRKITAAAVASANGVTPCGACRQVLREFASDVPVWIVDEGRNTVRDTRLAGLLPDSFTGDQLPGA